MQRECQTRIEARFKELIQALQAQSLVIREIAKSQYIVVFNHPNLPIEYVLAPFRRPKEPRVFTVFGNAVTVAVKISGLKHMEFDLIEAPTSGQDDT